jgi:hypothetical protein
VLEQAGVIAGVIVLLVENDNLLLGQCHSRSGAGGKRARTGAHDIRLYTHEKMTENIAMYRHFGWQETGRGEQSGYSRVFFRKRLT